MQLASVEGGATKRQKTTQQSVGDGGGDGGGPLVLELVPEGEEEVE